VGVNTSIVVPNHAFTGDLLLHALPCKVNLLQDVGCPPRDLKRLFIEHLVPNFFQIFGGSSVVKHVTSHIGESRDNLYQKLHAHGFEKEGLPTSLGGSWDYQQWIDHLVCDEGKHGKGKSPSPLFLEEATTEEPENSQGFGGR
jgi:hypothetical protein